MLYYDGLDMTYDKRSLLTEKMRKAKVSAFENSSLTFYNETKKQFSKTHGDPTKLFSLPEGMEGAFLINAVKNRDDSSCEFKLGHVTKPKQNFYIKENVYTNTRYIQLGYIEEDEKNHIFSIDIEGVLKDSIFWHFFVNSYSI